MMFNTELLYKQVLESNFSDYPALNELASYYLTIDKPFVSFLCWLASLLAKPNQSISYGYAEDVYKNNIHLPVKFQYINSPEIPITIIISTLNRPQTLQIAIESILNQSFQEYEVLIANNGGNEDAQLVIESFHNEKLHYYYEPRSGQYVATNMLLKEAKGEYITYLDDDDIIYPNHLETLYNSICLKNVDILYGRNRWVMGNWVDDQWNDSEDLTTNEKYDVSRLYRSCIIANQNVIHSRRVIENVGLYHDQPERGCDWEFRVRCSRCYDIERLSLITSEVRVPGKVPTRQPLRSQFYSRLWPIYFRSGFGELILAISAFERKEEELGWEHIQKIDTWEHLNKRALDALWLYITGNHIRNSNAVWEILSKYHPVWFSKKVVTHPSSIQFIHPQFVKNAAFSAVKDVIHDRIRGKK